VDDRLIVLEGTDALARAARTLPAGVRTGLLLADEAVVAAGYADHVRDELAGVERWEVRAVAPGEPTCATVDDLAAVVRSADHPVVVAVGGGSTLDAAKQAAVVAGGRRVSDHVLGAAPLPARTLPLVAIPTTAGTGAEVTRTCVVSDATGRKLWTWGDALRPDVVVLDPRATATMPRHVTAATGLDAFVHAVEAMTGRRSTAEIVRAASEAVRLVLGNLPAAMDDGTDLDVRLAMQRAALLAGMAIDTGGTGIAHSIGHALGTLAHVPHGVAVAVGLGAALDWNVAGAPDAFGPLAPVAPGRPPAAIGDVYRQLVDDADLAAAVHRCGPLTLDVGEVAATMVAPENRPMYDNNCRRADADERHSLAAATLTLWEALLPQAQR